jgi:hypothetical protein
MQQQQMYGGMYPDQQQQMHMQMQMQGPAGYGGMPGGFGQQPKPPAYPNAAGPQAGMMHPQQQQQHMGHMAGPPGPAGSGYPAAPHMDGMQASAAAAAAAASASAAAAAAADARKSVVPSWLRAEMAKRQADAAAKKAEEDAKGRDDDELEAAPARKAGGAPGVDVGQMVCQLAGYCCWCSAVLCFFGVAVSLLLLMTVDSTTAG